MKKLIILLSCLYSLTCYSQTILSLKLDGTKPSQITITPAVQKGINSLNATIKLFKDTANGKTLKALLAALNNPTIALLDKVSQLKAKIGLPVDITGDSLLNAKATLIDPKRVDSILVKIDSISDRINNACSKLNNATLKFIIDADDSYLGVIEDTSGNALGSFTLIQSNKELFYDKLKNALDELCDTAVVKGLIDRYKKFEPDLYTQFLEKKEDLANTNGLAGTLKIYKYTLVHYRDSADETRTDYPKIKSRKIAREEWDKILGEVENIKGQIDARAGEEMKKAKDVTDTIEAKRIERARDEIAKGIKDARTYRNSITDKMWSATILHHYKKAIRRLKRVRRKAKKAINDSEEPFKYAVTDPIHSGNGLVFDSISRVSGPAAGPDSSFTVQSMQIQFEDGFIENIKIFGKLKGNPHLLRFENVYPIGFSTKRDFRNLIDKYLYEKSDYHINEDLFIKLGEVISYDQNLANYNKDYSPANQVLTVKALPDTIKEVILYKEQTSKLLEVQVFSDLKGADDSNPNGLIQLELNKRLNFFSSRFPLTNNILPWRWFKKGGEIIANFGLGNYITPQFTIDKIENNQKRLVLSHVDTLSLAADTSKPVTYASTINLLRHQIYSIGFDQSLLLIDIPSIKSTLNFGTGIHFGRTAIQDTLRTRVTNDTTHFFTFHAATTNNVIEYGINTFQWGPYLTWQIFPDSRFGITATQRFTWFKALTSNFIQVRDSAHYLKFIAQTQKNEIRATPYSYYNYGSSNWFVKNIDKPFSLFTKCIASAEIFAYFSPNGDGSNKLFFRYRINWDLANPKENFHQLQVGFSTYLTATKEYDKLKKNANID